MIHNSQPKIPGHVRFQRMYHLFKSSRNHHAASRQKTQKIIIAKKTAKIETQKQKAFIEFIRKLEKYIHPRETKKEQEKKNKHTYTHTKEEGNQKWVNRRFKRIKNFLL